MTEAERYEKSLYRPSKKQQKRNPQEQWMDLIERSVENSPADLKSYMAHLASLGNVPRKEKQFRNFTANSLNLRGKQSDTVNQIWKFLTQTRERERLESQPAEDNNSRPQEEEEEEGVKPQHQEQHQSHLARPNNQEKDGVTAPNNSEKEAISPQKVRKTMRKILKQEKIIKVRLLRAKVRKALGLDKSLNKKLKKLLKTELEADESKIKLDGKLVKLLN
jgi:hypothetical protein